MNASTNSSEISLNLFAKEVLAGLQSQPKTLPCKYFYDLQGSQLFAKICRQPEYYLTRTELAIMKEYRREIAAVCGKEVWMVELGSGSSIKTRILLDTLNEPVAYMPVDISQEHLLATVEILAKAYPHIQILPVCADFTQNIRLPKPARFPERTVVYFPGSTIGNFIPAQAQRLFLKIGKICGPQGGLLIGVDLKKSPAVLESAYNDKNGITAAFNLNLLEHINRRLDADFRVDQFAHQAIYNEEYGRIEMRLLSLCSQRVHIYSYSLDFIEGESILTEYSHKYSLADFARLAESAGFRVEQAWTDPQQLFSVQYLVKECD